MPFNVTIKKYNATIMDGPPVVNENAQPQRQKLRYELRRFRADATLTCQNTEAEPWYVGFVQSCLEVENIAVYDDHATRWDPAPPMPRCDCCGGPNHPWYGTGMPNNGANLGQTGLQRQEVGAGANQDYLLSMNDNLCANVPWYDPVPFGPAGAVFPVVNPYPVALTEIYRHQEFTAFLIAAPKNNPGRIFQIQAISTWIVRTRVDIDPKKPLGTRVKAIADLKAECYTRLKGNFAESVKIHDCLAAPACPGTMNNSTFNGYHYRGKFHYAGAIGGLIGPLSQNY